jgi:hypothetical protein
MTTLLDIGLELQALASLMAEASDADGELTAEQDSQISAWFAELTGARDQKIDGYCALIRTCELRSAARKEEAERLQKRVQADANLARNLKARLLEWMTLQGERRIETARYRLSVCANGGKAPMEVGPTDQLPDALTITTRSPNSEAIRKHLELALDVPGCRLLPRGQHLRIS